MSLVSPGTAAEEPRNVGHLGDFTTTKRMLLVTALALPVGAASACVAWALLRLIGFLTNVIFYERFDSTRLVAPGGGHHSPLVVLFAQFLRLTADERKTLLVGGSAAGMAATFNTPFAAIML
ncbi:MAG: chloride channel protein, partial [Trebonia sp.]